MVLLELQNEFHVSTQKANNLTGMKKYRKAGKLIGRLTNSFYQVTGKLIVPLSKTFTTNFGKTF
jgi:hypothetical protein